MPPQQYVLDGIPEDTLNNKIIGVRRFKTEASIGYIDGEIINYTYNTDNTISAKSITRPPYSNLYKLDYTYDASGNIIKSEGSFIALIDCSQPISCNELLDC